jgi:hypothetical protein
MVGFMGDDVSCTNGRVTLQLHAAYVTPNAFQFLGMDPLLGRSIGPEDAKPAAPPVFAMNYRLWQKHFNASPKIVGTSFVVGGCGWRRAKDARGHHAVAIPNRSRCLQRQARGLRHMDTIKS